MVIRRDGSERRGPSKRRRGMTTLEVVWITAFTLPVAVGLFLLAVRASRILFRTNAELVSWPLM